MRRRQDSAMTDKNSPFEKPTLDKDLDRLGLIEGAALFLMQRAAGPGLALIFLAASAVFATLFVTESSESVVIVIAAVVAAYMAMNIGANDVTNNVGAAVGARAISMSGALAIAAVAEIAGAMLAGNDVVSTIKSDIVDPALLNGPDQMITIMVSALLAAALWINIATWINAPVSTTHSIVGAIMGAGVAVGGMGAVEWPALVGITASWIASPLLGGAIAIAFLWFISEYIIYREDKIAAACRWVPILLAAMSGTFLAYFIMIAFPRASDTGLGQALLAGAVVGAASYFWFRVLVARKARNLENRNQSLKILFRVPLVLSAAMLSFAHGANDVSNAIGPLAAIVEASGIQTVSRNLDAPFWVTVIGALGISTGLMLFGPRLIRIVGSQITRLNPLRAYCVAMSAAITVLVASAFGLPVSSTHIAVGAVFGVGLFREWYTSRSTRRRLLIESRAATGQAEAPVNPAGQTGFEERRERQYRYLVRRSYLLSILAAWVITLPASGLLSAAFAFALTAMMG
jgi:PiT family inorganic phosphate transporter